MLSSKIVLTIIKNMKKYLQNLMVKKKKSLKKMEEIKIIFSNSNIDPNFNFC